MLNKRYLILIVCAAVLSFTSLCLADKLILKSGKVIEGTVIKNTDTYWVKPYNGDDPQTISADDVDSVVRGGAAGSAGDAGTGAVSPSEGVVTSVQFSQTKRTADLCDVPLDAVNIWQKFLAGTPAAGDVKPAQAELDRWKALLADGAERINGKWVKGAERKAIVDQANADSEEAKKLIESNQTLAAMKKLGEAQKLYPNNFQVNFFISYLDLISHNDDEALKMLELCKKEHPASAAVMNNYGVCMITKKMVDKSVLAFEHAAELQDSPEIAQNLVSSIALLNERLRTADQFKPALEAARVLAVKYRVAGPKELFLLMDREQTTGGPGGGGEDIPEGAFAEGTGFFLNADGLILTNHHVINGAKKLTVILPGGKQVPAEVVVIDDEQDLALIRIKTSVALPFLHLAKDDHPGDGSDCVALGYPMMDKLGSAIKVTRGIVSSGNNGDALGADILTDTKVNPGNSGGPLVNSHGGVMGIVTLKSLSSEMEDSYGMAIGAGHIRKFLAKNKVDSAPADETGAALDAAEIAKQIEPSTVCIIAQH